MHVLVTCKCMQVLCIQWVSVLLIVIGTLSPVSAIPGLVEDIAEHDSATLQKLRSIETRLEKKRAAEGQDVAANEQSESFQSPIGELINVRSSSNDADNKENDESNDGHQYLIQVVRRKSRQSLGAIENFQACYADFYYACYPLLKNLTLMLKSDAPAILNTLTELFQVFPKDDISFQTRDINKMCIKFHMVFDIMNLVEQKMVTFIKPGLVDLWNKNLSFVMLELSLAKFATANLAFDQSNTIDIVAGGISGINKGTQMGIGRDLLQNIFSMAKCLLSSGR